MLAPRGVGGRTGVLRETITGVVLRDERDAWEPQRHRPQPFVKPNIVRRHSGFHIHTKLTVESNRMEMVRLGPGRITDLGTLHSGVGGAAAAHSGVDPEDAAEAEVNGGRGVPWGEPLVEESVAAVRGVGHRRHRLQPRSHWLDRWGRKTSGYVSDL